MKPSSSRPQPVMTPITVSPAKTMPWVMNSGMPAATWESDGM